MMACQALRFPGGEGLSRTPCRRVRAERARLHFPNRFPSGPTVQVGPLDPRWVGVGDASSGLCGGMSWYVRERFEAGKPVAARNEPPTNGSPLFRAIVRRQVLSLDWFRVPLRF